MNGVVIGGWGYVWAAYGLTALALAAYGISLWARWRSEARRLAAQRVREEEPR